jgi:hypothetical protein
VPHDRIVPGAPQSPDRVPRRPAQICFATCFRRASAVSLGAILLILSSLPYGLNRAYRTHHERLEKALAARTESEFAALVTDLIATAAPAASGTTRSWWPQAGWSSACSSGATRSW